MITVSIHSKGTEVELISGICRISVLGGWHVKLGDFVILFRNLDTGEVIRCKKVFWPIQYYRGGDRATLIWSTRVPEPGRYRVEFENPERLEVKRSNLFLHAWFEGCEPNDNLKVYISNAKKKLR